jgi:hypothetical protein
MPDGSACRPKLTCRLCDSRDLRGALTLTPTPPANAFVPVPVPQESYPLEVRLCGACGHAQLGHVVDPEILFRDYVYVSGTSPVFRKHFESYAQTARERVGLKSGDLVCEIGSNDGTLLGQFRDLRMLGIEPATAIARDANAAGIETINAFFTPRLAEEVRASLGPARLVLANNVMAHIDDLGGVVDGVRRLLADDGMFVMEVQYVGDLLRDGLFDMIYFEHVDYHAVAPLIPFFARHGMKLVDVEHVDTHGGSIRCFATLATSAAQPAERVAEFVQSEEREGTSTLVPWHALRDKIARRREELRSLLQRLKAEGKRVVGYGAPAKLTTLLYAFGIGAETLEYVVDDSPLKIGLYTPGLHVPVRASAALYDPATRPDAVLVCAWNFAPSIISRHAQLSGVSWITPLPDLTVTP